MHKITHAIQKLGFFILLLSGANNIQAQAIGGNAVYGFINLPYSAKATALGGIHISDLDKDIGLAMYNPALLDPSMNGSFQISVKPNWAAINQYDLSAVHASRSSKITWGWGIHYLDYGSIPMTDNTGSSIGTMHPTDYLLQISAASSYQQNFQVGATLKYIQSNYGIYQSNGLAMDVGLNFTADNGLSKASILVNNMGIQLKKYTNPENLPFNITIGYSKKLEHAPFHFSLTAQRVATWNSSYEDTTFNILEGQTSSTAMRNILNHLILGTQIDLGKQFQINLGYNFLRRQELNIQNQYNGLNGFSFGIATFIKSTQLQYANAFFQHHLGHQITIVHSFKRSY